MNHNTTSAILQLLDPLKQLEEKIKSIELIMNSCSTSQRRLLEMIENSLMDSVRELEKERAEFLRSELEIAEKTKEGMEKEESRKQAQTFNITLKTSSKTERAKEIIIECLKNNESLEWKEIVSRYKPEDISEAAMRDARGMLHRDGRIDMIYLSNGGQATGTKCRWFLMDKAQGNEGVKND